MGQRTPRRTKRTGSDPERRLYLVPGEVPDDPLGSPDPLGDPNPYLPELTDLDGLDGLEGFGAELSPSDLFRTLLRTSPGFTDELDPIEAELWCSEMLGTLWDLSGGDPAMEEAFCLDLVVAAEAERTAEAQAVLCSITAVGVPTAAARAEAAAARLAEQGVAWPRWAEAVRSLSVRECWRYGDAFGDQESLLCVFAYGERTHALIVLIDHVLGGIAKDAFLADDPDRAVAEIRREVQTAPIMFLERVDPAEARVRIERAFAVTDTLDDPEVSEDFAAFRAIALSRARALTAPYERSGAPVRSISAAPGHLAAAASDPHSVGERAADQPDPLVEEFLAAPEAADLPDPVGARRLVEFIIGHRRDQGDDPVRVSPLILEDLLLNEVPAHVALDATAKKRLPAVITAWSGWVARRNGLSPAAASWLWTELHEILAEFPRAYAERSATAHRRSCPDVLDLRSRPAARAPRVTPTQRTRSTQRARPTTPTRRAPHAELTQGAGSAPLTGPAQRTGPTRPVRVGAAVGTVHRLKITLRGSKPPIWRRIEVPSSITLADLHQVIQVAMGWTDSHLHAFETPTGDYGVPDAELGHRDERQVRLAAVAPDTGARLSYLYDFGDRWEHVIQVEQVLDAAGQPDAATPRCTGGRRAAPPEDCGGLSGYEDFLAALADPDAPELADRRDWIDALELAGFDPAVFDRAAVNAALAALPQ